MPSPVRAALQKPKPSLPAARPGLTPASSGAECYGTAAGSGSILAVATQPRRRPALPRRARNLRSGLRNAAVLRLEARDLPGRGPPRASARARGPPGPHLRHGPVSPPLPPAPGRLWVGLLSLPARARSGCTGFQRGGGRGCDDGEEEGAAPADRRAGPPRARPARTAGPAARLAALRPGLRDPDPAALGPSAADARLGRRAPREPPPAAARPPPALRPGPPGHAQVLAVAARRALLLAPHTRAAGLHRAELGPREGLGRPDLQREDGGGGPGDRACHVPRLAAGAQARGGGFRRLHARDGGQPASRALPTSAPGHDPGSATEKRGHQRGGAPTEPGEDSCRSLGLPCKTGDQGEGQGNPSLTWDPRSARG